MAVRWFLLLASLGGCHKLFDLDVVHHGVGDGGADDGGDADDSAMPLGNCSSTSLVSNDFVSGTQWFPLVSGSPMANAGVVTGGALQIDMVNEGYSTVAMLRAFDMRDDRLTFEVVENGFGTGDIVELYLEALEPDVWIRCRHQGNDLVIERNETGSPAELKRVTYSPTMHRFLRFEHSGTQIEVQASETGTTGFTTLATAFAVDWADYVTGRMFVTRSPGAPAFRVQLDSVHGGMSMVGACPVAQLQDDFGGSGATAPETWRTAAYHGTMLQSGGELVFTYTGANQYLNARTVSRRVFDLRGGSVTLEIAQMFATNGPMRFELGVEGVGGAKLAFLQQQGSFTASSGSTTVYETTFAMAEHRFWRIREAGGMAFWEVSADGSEPFTPVATASVSGVESVELVLQANGTESTAGATLRLAGVNAP